MADGNSTAGRAESVAPFGLPMITIPPEHQINDYGSVLFQIETTAGPVSVRAFLWGFYCGGSAKSLQAAGLVRKEWMPGEPGNNAIRQTVIFDSDGPRLMFGRWKGSKHNNYENRVTITRSSRDKYRVTVPATHEQGKYLKAQDEQRAKARQEAAQRAAIEKARKEAEPKSIAAFREGKMELLGMLGSLVELMARASERYSYTSEEQGRMRSAMADIRRAVAGGVVVEKQECRRVGNVLYLNTP